MGKACTPFLAASFHKSLTISSGTEGYAAGPLFLTTALQTLTENSCSEFKLRVVPLVNLSTMCTSSEASHILLMMSLPFLKDTHFLSYCTVKLLGLLQGSKVGEREDETMAELTIARTLDPSGCSANSFNQSNGL